MMNENSQTKRLALTIGSRLIELRKQNALTQEQASKQLGLSRTTLNYYESDKRKPDFEQFANLAQFYGVSLSYLAGIDKEQLVGLSDSAVYALKWQYGTYVERANDLISKMLESPLFQSIIRDVFSVMDAEADTAAETFRKVSTNSSSVVLEGEAVVDFYKQRAISKFDNLIVEMRKEYKHGKERNP